MNDKYGKCYCGDCISFNKCKSDKGTRINLNSEGCLCFEPNDIAEFDYPILPKWLAEHDKQVRADAINEAIHIADCSHTDCWDCAFGEADICKLQQFYGQLKEQK